MVSLGLSHKSERVEEGKGGGIGPTKRANLICNLFCSLSFVDLDTPSLLIAPLVYPLYFVASSPTISRYREVCEREENGQVGLS